jgi:cytochrome c oxidase subunit 2
MRILRFAVPVFTIIAVFAACTSNDDADTTPEGVSPPIPVAANAGLVQISADALGAPIPISGSGAALPSDPIEAGMQVARNNACTACHTTDGTKLVGPSWKGLFGKSESMTDGSSVTIDDAYLAESIRNPKARVVQGFADAMPDFGFLSDEEVNALIAYIKSLN